MDQKICETSMMEHLITKFLKEAFGENAILRSFVADKIAAGQGHMSNILRLKLTWESSNNDLPSSVIVKTPAIESLNKLMSTYANSQTEKVEERLAMSVEDFVILSHQKECSIYQIFMAAKQPPLAVPKCFLTVPVRSEEEPGVVLLEDMSGKASIAPSYLEGLTYKQTLSAVTEIARLHAWSLTTIFDWRSQIHEEPEESIKSFLAPLPAAFKSTKENYPAEFGSLDLDRVMKFCSYEACMSINWAHREFMDDALVHGDFHMNNILFEKNEDGTLSDHVAAVIDFQAAMNGCPMYDVGRLLSFSVSHTLRRQRGEEILRRYYDELKLTTGDKFKGTFEQVRRVCLRQFAMEALFAASCIQTLNIIMINSSGEQRAKDEKQVLESIKANYDDAIIILAAQ